MNSSIAKLLNETHDRIQQADDWMALAAAMDTLLAAVTELARLAPDESTMNSKQREHARAAFDRGFPGDALR